MKSALFLLLLATASFGSAATLPATDFPIVNARPGLAPYARQNVEIAASRDQYLAVWEDSRSFPSGARMFATRIAGPGIVVDPLGFPIGPLGPPDPKSRVQAVGSDGNDFLVAFTIRGDLRFVKVTSEAVAGDVRVPGVQADQVAMAWLGSGYAVFVTDPPSNGELSSTVRVFFVDRDGSFATSPSVAVLSPGIPSIAAVASADGSDVLLGWIDTADQAVHLYPYSASLLRNGQPVAVQQVFPLNSTLKLSALGLATNGTEFFATWIELQNGQNSYRARRFLQTGAPVAAAVTLAPAAEFEPLRPLVAWDGTGYTVTMKTTAGAGVRAGFFHPDGSPATAQPVLVGEGNVPDAAIASFGTYSFLIWNEVRPGGVSEIYGDAVTPGGGPRYGPGQSALLSRSQPDVSDVSVLWQGDHYLAAWLETSDATRAVIGRFTPTGDLLDGSGVTISSGPRSSAPSLATNGATVLAAWADTAGVSIVSVDASAHVVKVGGPYAAPLERPSLLWNGSQFVIFWHGVQGLTALRAGADGRVIDSQPAIVSTAGGTPVAGWTGSEYVVVTREPSTSCPLAPCTTEFLSAQFVTSSLSRIGPSVPLADADAGEPSVVDGQNGSLITWVRRVGGVATIRAARAAHGALLDPVNGVNVSLGESASAFAAGGGWVLVSGPYTWAIASDGTIGQRVTSFSFVPPGGVSALVSGGPARLVVYRRPPVGNEQMAPVLAHYLFEPRHRPVRH